VPIVADLMFTAAVTFGSAACGVSVPSALYPSYSSLRGGDMLRDLRQEVQGLKHNHGHRPPDIVPVRICPGSAGSCGHGHELPGPVQARGNDFGDVNAWRLPPRSRQARWSAAA
jgi:hypothetical protein